MKALAVIAVVLAASGGRQVRDQPARQPAVGTGGVTGRVVNAQTRQPIADAVVALVGGETAVIRVAQTDVKGAFVLPGVPAGKFLLSASKLPYLGALHGASRPGRPGTPIVVAEAQIVAGLEIEMWPGAVVTGMVSDELGEPVQGVQVQLQRPRGGGSVMAQALMLIGGGPSSTTDDRGIYRIYGAAPGDYLVVASVPQALGRARRMRGVEVAEALRAVREKPPAGGRPAVAASPPAAPGPGRGLDVSYAPVYFPGTTDLVRATPVTVAMGEERSGINIGLEVMPLARVEGVVFAADGAIAPNVQVTLQRQDDASLIAMLRSESNRAQTSQTGQFTVRNVAPGQYRVMARAGGTGEPPAGPTFWASVDVTIGGQDVTGLTLQLRPAMSLAGRIVVDPAAKASLPDLTDVMAVVVPLTRTVDSIGLFASLIGGTGGHSARADGTFEVGGLVAGVHVATANVIGSGPADMLTWRVGSVMMDGRDVTDLPFDLKPGAMPKDVVVTVTDVQQRLSGVIADSSGRPLTASTVLLFGTDRRYWYPESRRVLAARPGTDGSYDFTGLLGPAAGEYYLTVVTDLDPDQQYDPAFLDALVKAGPIRLTLARGERKRQDLKAR